ncbi:MAG: A/G-specific adenine glycosylase [Sneathiella sp.]
MNNHFFEKTEFSDKILDWYDENARALPWRSLSNVQANAYHVWLSEIMLQQTTVATVGPYFKKFLKLWPTVEHLANSPLDDVLSAWAGLGYYARARNLHKCAVAICHEYGGVFPTTEEALLTLPGIGAYTSAAIAAIAYGQAAVVIDGNIERIISRVFRISEQLPAARKKIREGATVVSPEKRPGDYAQALMDIGATICTPKKPLCHLCPVSQFCSAFDAGDAETYPVKAPKKIKPTRRAAILWIDGGAGDILMRRREEKGLLGGMMEFPSTEWVVETYDYQAALKDVLSGLGLGKLKVPENSVGSIKHTFTHFHLVFSIYSLTIPEKTRSTSNEARWINPADFTSIAMPTLMSKVAKAILADQKTLAF